MALQWRTVSTSGRAASARQPHVGRPATRGTLLVRASIVNPHSILGVSATADVKEVKRAYRKLALQYHPDVCKSEDGHQRFMALTQAYEMLLGRAEGKTDPNHASSSGWDFHDWYWNFRMQRSWEKQQRQAKAAAAAAAADPTTDPYECDGPDPEPGCGRRAPPHGHAGHKQPEARANLRSQLAGLRHRAAVRANRQSSSSSSSGAASDAASGAAASAAAAGSTSSCCGGATSGQRQQHTQYHPHQQPSASQWAWSWTWDDTLESSDDEQGPTGAASAASAAAAAAGLHHQYTHVYDSASGGGSGGSAAAAPADATAAAAAAAGSECPVEHMAVHDGHFATVLANHAVPFPGFVTTAAASTTGQHQQQPQQAHSLHYRPHLHSAAAAAPPPPHNERQCAASAVATAEAAAGYDVSPGTQPDMAPGAELMECERAAESEPEPFSNPYEAAAGSARGPWQQARRRFAADSASREAVSHQLTGLRRKATIKAQWGAAVGGSGSGSDA